MSVDRKLIGSRIKERRRSSGKTQEVLAERLGVSTGYVSQLERGITKISLDTLAEIADCLGCDVSYFLTGSSTNSENYLSAELSDAVSALSEKERQALLEMIKIYLKLTD